MKVSSDNWSGTWFSTVDYQPDHFVNADEHNYPDDDQHENITMNLERLDEDQRNFFHHH